MLLVSRIRASHNIANRLLHAGIAANGSSSNAVHNLLDSVDQLKRRTMSSGRSWSTLFSLARAVDLLDLCTELEHMVQKGSAETRAASRRSINTLPASLKLASDGGCQLSDDKKRTVAKQLRDAGGPVHISLAESKLLMGPFGRNISNYPPGGDDISYIASAEPLTTFLIAAKAQLTQPASARLVPLIPLLKLSTYRWTAADRWIIVYFGHLVYNNVIKTPPSIKKDSSHFSEAHTSFDRQDLWALPPTMEDFGICVLGFASAVELLVHPSTITAAEVMDLFRKIAEHYERFDCRLTIATIVDVFYDHVTTYFTRLRQ